MTTTETAAFACTLCGGTDATTVLDMGAMPLANAFAADRDAAIAAPRWDVEFVRCSACALLQLASVPPGELMFSRYPWASSSSASAHRYVKRLATRLAGGYPPADHPFLVEIASNDGLFLRQARGAGYRVLGVDPSDLADEANEDGIPTVRAFFGAETAQRVRDEHGPADLIVARNVLGHVASMRDLVRGIDLLLGPDGVVVIEVPYCLNLRDQLQYDTIFHEHVSYLSATTVTTALTGIGVRPVRWEFVDMNGGSVVCVGRRDTAGPAPATATLTSLEDMVELNVERGWATYARQVDDHRNRLRELVRDEVATGARVAVYGAAAKTMTLLNFAGIDADLIGVIGDVSPRKQGLYAPGTGVPVVSPKELIGWRPDVVVVGPWNLRDEIVGDLRGMGFTGRFVVPSRIPQVLR